MSKYCRRWLLAILPAILLFFCFGVSSRAASKKKPHTVFLGSARMVPYSAEADPSGARPGETQLAIRPLLVDGVEKAWTTGEMHTVTGHTFVIEQAIQVNDDLPGEQKVEWIWQRGPWLLVDRTHASYKQMRLPDYEPGISDVAWFRDMAAYCAVKPSGRELLGLVYQIGVRRPLLSKKLGKWSVSGDPEPACQPPVWQRQPLSVAYQQPGGTAVAFDLFGPTPRLPVSGPTTPSSH